MAKTRSQAKTVALLAVKDDGSIKVLDAEGKSIPLRKSKSGPKMYNPGQKLVPLDLRSYGVTFFKSTASDPCIRIVIENQAYCFVLRSGASGWECIPCPCPLV